MDRLNCTNHYCNSFCSHYLSDCCENQPFFYSPCIICPESKQGPPGIRGPAGPAGGVLSFADFYALMPPDNADTVAPGQTLAFRKTDRTVALILRALVRILSN